MYLYCLNEYQEAFWQCVGWKRIGIVGSSYVVIVLWRMWTRWVWLERRGIVWETWLQHLLLMWPWEMAREPFLGVVGCHIEYLEHLMKAIDSCPRKMFMNTLFTLNCTYSLRRPMDLLQSVHVGALILDQGPLTWFLSEVPSSSEILLKKNYNLYFQHRNSVFVFFTKNKWYWILYFSDSLDLWQYLG